MIDIHITLTMMIVIQCISDMIWICVLVQISCCIRILNAGGGTWWEMIGSRCGSFMNGLAPTPGAVLIIPREFSQDLVVYQCVDTPLPSYGFCSGHVMCLFPFFFCNDSNFPESCQKEKPLHLLYSLQKCEPIKFLFL